MQGASIRAKRGPLPNRGERGEGPLIKFKTMFLKPHQMYLESQGLYQKICRLAQVRTEIKSLTVEEDHLVQCIYDAMCPATEIVDLVFLRAQKGVSEADLSEMFVARWQESERIMDVHPAYVSDRFRPGNNVSEAPVTTTTEKEAERSKEEEREVAVVIDNEKDEVVEKGKEAEEADDADTDIRRWTATTPRFRVSYH